MAPEARRSCPLLDASWPGSEVTGGAIPSALAGRPGTTRALPYVAPRTTGALVVARRTAASRKRGARPGAPVTWWNASTVRNMIGRTSQKKEAASVSSSPSAVMRVMVMSDVSRELTTSNQALQGTRAPATEGSGHHDLAPEPCRPCRISENDHEGEVEPGPHHVPVLGVVAGRQRVGEIPRPRHLAGGDEDQERGDLECSRAAADPSSAVRRQDRGLWTPLG